MRPKASRCGIGCGAPNQRRAEWNRVADPIPGDDEEPASIIVIIIIIIIIVIIA
jgi:hypothetical protein